MIDERPGIDHVQAVATELGEARRELARRSAAVPEAERRMRTAQAEHESAQRRAAALGWGRRAHLRHLLRGDLVASRADVATWVRAAQDRAQATRQAFEDLERDVDALGRRVQALTERESAARAIRARTTLLAWTRSGDSRATHLVRAIQDEARLRARIKQLGDAREALASARAATEHLAGRVGSATDWGSYDTFFGGGLLSSSLKHARVDEANAAAARLRTLLIRVRQELSDLDVDLDVPGIEVSSTTRTLDVWFDNLLTDLAVQQRLRQQAVDITHLSGRLAALDDALRVRTEETVQDHVACMARRDDIAGS
jgi:hypothetical protein